MYCNSCGSMFPDGNPCCPNCGAPAPQPASQPVNMSPAQPIQYQPILISPSGPDYPANACAIVGLIFGIISFVLCWFPIIGQILAIVGLILSIVGVSRRTPRAKGAAITGLILSIFGLIIGLGACFLGVGTYLNKAKQASVAIRDHNNSYLIQEEYFDD